MNIEAEPSQSPSKRIVIFLAIMTVYGILSGTGILLTHMQSNLAAFWISNGFLVAALLRYTPMAVIQHILACAAIGFVMTFGAGDSWANAFFVSFSNALVVGIAIALIRRKCGPNPDFAKLRDFAWFSLLGGFVAPVVSCGIAIALFSLVNDVSDLHEWTDWLITNSLGILIVAPLGLTLAGNFEGDRKWNKKTSIEHLIILVVGGLLTALVFIQSSYPFLFMITFFVLVAAVRQGISGASMSVAIVAIIAIVATLAGTGPVQLANGNIHENTLVLQIFLLFTFASSLPFASILEAQSNLQHKLSVSRDQTQSIFDNMRDVVFRTDELGHWTVLNPAWQAMTGYSVEQSLGWPLTKLLTKKSLKIAEVEYPRFVSGELSTLTLKLTFYRADGKERHIEVLFEAIRDEDGQFAGATGNIRDITDARTARHKLQKSEARFRRLAESAPVGFFQADAEGKMVYVSKAWREQVGLSEEDAAGDGWMNDLKDQTPFQLDEAFKGFKKPGDRREREACYTKPDGEEIWVRTVNQAEFDIERNIIGYVGVIVDITDQRKMIEDLRQSERSLREARDIAEASAEAKASFLANMSHEIRTPMNGVIGFAEMLRQSELNEKQAQYVELIGESGKVMMALLNDILDISKIDSGLLTLSPEPFDLQHMLTGTRNMMLTAAGNQGLALNLEFAPDLPKFIEHDKLRLRQILTNLIGNAVKFTKEGSITVKAEVADEDGQNFRISVIDTGIGIPEDRQRSIFDEFVQAEDDTDRSYGGTGLGLAISRKLAQMMGGDIGLESIPGLGSTFFIEIPLRESIDLRGERKKSSDIVKNMTTLPAVDRTILLVEDHEINRLLATAMLERMGCTVICAENGKQALEILTTNKGEEYDFGLVLMDIQMPIMDGIEGTRRIRQSGITTDELPIIALTANAFAEDKEICAAAGMQDHVAKPIQFNDLYKAVCNWYHDPKSQERTSAMELAEEDPTIALLRPKYTAFRTEIFASLSMAKETISHWSDKQCKEIMTELHKLSGSAGTFGDDEIGAQAKQLENAIKNNDSTDILLALSSDLLASIRGDNDTKARQAA